jgi:hypothetical protein
MARKRFRPEQIVAILREAERCGDNQKVIRKNGISDQTFYRWKKMYGGMGISEIQRFKDQAGVYRTREPMGKWLYRELQRQVARRVL